MLTLPPGWEIPSEISARMSQKVGRQRAIVEAGHLLLIVHKNPDTERLDRESTFFWRDPAGTWRSSIGRAALSILDAHFEDYRLTIDKLQADYRHAERSKEYFTILKAIVPLHRAVNNLKNTLQSAREAVPKAPD